MPHHHIPASSADDSVGIADTSTGLPLLVALVDLDEDPMQPRQEFPDERQQDLTASVAVAGIKQPLIVRPADRGPARSALCGLRLSEP